MRRRWKLGVVIVCLALAACQPGTPDKGFSSGTGQTVIGWPYDTGQVLRDSDGSVLVSRYGWNEGGQVVRLTPAGQVDAAWGDAGTADVGFQWGPSSSGFDEGTILADGSVILFGGLDQYRLGSIRLTPTGARDDAYGTGGEVTASDGFAGTGADSCSLTADGTLVCAAGGADAITITSWNAAGQPLPESSVPIDLSAFTTPPGAYTGTIDHARVLGFAAASRADASGVLVALRVGTAYYDHNNAILGFEQGGLAVVRVTPAGLDVSFGSGGYRRVQFGFDGAGAITTSPARNRDATPYAIRGGSHGITVLAKAPGSSGPLQSALVHLTSTGAVDGAFSGDGLTAVTTPAGDPVDAARLDARDGDKITVVGTAGTTTPGGHEGVVVRYSLGGVLDTKFSDDGGVTLEGTHAAGGLDLRNGRVTVTGVGEPDEDGNAPITVQVMYG